MRDTGKQVARPAGVGLVWAAVGRQLKIPYRVGVHGAGCRPGDCHTRRRALPHAGERASAPAEVPAFTGGCSCRSIAAGFQQHCSASRRWPIRGKVAVVMVDRIPGGNAELLIMAYISGGKPRTSYALMGSDCLSNSADHLWASGVTNNQGIAVLTGPSWTSNSRDYYWTWTQPSAGTTPPPALHGPSATGYATALKADRVLCAPYLLHGRFKIIS